MTETKTALGRVFPILFSGPMVRALLAGRKTQTRRVMRYQPTFNADRRTWEYQSPKCSASWSGSKPLACGKLIAQDDCPYGARGDRLWVKETWGLSSYTDDTDWIRGSVKGRSQDDIAESWKLRFAADYDGPTSSEYPYWRPSIFMPRWASRLTLEVTDVRVERVQDISEADAKAEGAERVNGHPERGAWFGCGPSFREGFAQLWMDINGVESYESNPWVWIVEFRTT